MAADCILAPSRRDFGSKSCASQFYSHALGVAPKTKQARNRIGGDNLGPKLETNVQIRIIARFRPTVSAIGHGHPGQHVSRIYAQKTTELDELLGDWRLGGFTFHNVGIASFIRDCSKVDPSRHLPARIEGEEHIRSACEG